jgi:nitrate/TMAO reductase-like tetraheme cytochrome c subunit
VPRPRYLTDDYELPDDDDDLPYEGKLYRRKRRSPALPAFIALFTVLLIAGVASFFHFSEQQKQDAFCISCHTPQHRAYLNRAEAAVGGALADDLSSFHYQQIRGQGGEIRCIDCHRGDGSTNDRLETMLLSARLAAAWLAASDDRTIEKTAITSTVISGITQTVLQTTLALHAPRLTNASCIGCHTGQLLVAGPENHHHNTLPAVYDAWKAGARLTAPKNVTETQTIATQGLVRYETTVQCTSCHQTHRTTEAANYLDRQGVVKPACEQCHRQTGAGPLEVTIPEEQ